MRRTSLFLGSLLMLAACMHGAVANPDPNHTHADFAIWIQGGKIDFSADEYMSGSSTDPDHKDAKNPYLHLHDGNGDVVHRHKPGLMMGEFFESLGVRYRKESDCIDRVGDFQACDGSPTGSKWRMFVNGKERAFDWDYVFEDLDRILLIHTKNEEDLQKALDVVTDDACLYSRTCPERGDPPTENCVADPEVPCVIPE